MPAIGTKEVNVGPALGYDPSMQVPLAGEPGYHADSGSDFIDERFAPLDTTGSGHGSAALKKFLEEQIAEKTPATTVEVGSHQFRVYYKEGAWRAKGIVDGQLHRLSDSTRDGVISKLMQFAKRDVIHDLTRSQEIEIARICQSGNKAEGIARYLEYRLGPERAQKYSNGSEMVSDPVLQNVLAECAYFCWLNFRADVQDSQEFRDFVQEYAGTRPLNFDVLNAAHAAWLSHKERLTREVAAARFGKREEPTPAEIQQSLEDADDETIRRTYKAVARAAR